MQVAFLMRSTVLVLLLAGVACARKNSSDTEVGAASDTTRAGITDSATVNQTESGMTDSSGAEKTPADQGQPVTSKGDTLNPSVDSSTTAR